MKEFIFCCVRFALSLKKRESNNTIPCITKKEPKNCMKNILLAAVGAMGVLCSYAQQGKPTINVDGEFRTSFYNDRVGDEIRHDHSGFKGDYLNLSVSGNINSKFSYAWRQRLNKKIENNQYFDATDWVYLNYEADKNWSMAAGKQVVLIGGYEYDKAPIDEYTTSEYWNNTGCFRFGGSVTYTTNAGNDKFSAQFSESPCSYPGCHDIYAYNIFWVGVHGPFETLYSLNLLQYSSTKYISYISLGNRFRFGNTVLELDFMNRAASHQTFFFRDCSVVADLKCKVLPKLKLYGKFIYDVNNTNTDADKTVWAGTELTTYAGGLEFFPMKNKEDIRINAGVAHTHGKNANPNGTLLDDRLTVQVGLTAKLHLFKYGK